MTALSARSIALSDQILSALAGEGGLPVSTMDLWQKLRAGAAPESRDWREVLDEVIAHSNGRGTSPLPVGYPDVLRNLHRLARLGKVEQVRVEDRRSLYWRRWQ